MTETAVVGDFKQRAGRRVEARRRQLRMSQVALAEAARTTQQTVSRIEKGRVNPSDPIKARVAGALEVTVSELWNYDAEE